MRVAFHPCLGRRQLVERKHAIDERAAALDTNIAELQKRILQTPTVEAEYSSLQSQHQVGRRRGVLFCAVLVPERRLGRQRDVAGPMCSPCCELAATSGLCHARPDAPARLALLLPVRCWSGSVLEQRHARAFVGSPVGVEHDER